MWIFLYRFHKIYPCRKTLSDYTNLFTQNYYKNNESISKINMLEETSLEFMLRKVDETKNYLLDEIKHND